MSGRGQTGITPVSEQAWQLAQKLAESVSGLPPVPLNNYAEQLCIRRIRFEPLLSTAGLARDGKDFEIIVNTEAVHPSKKAGLTLAAEDDSWRELPPTLRFTVAHEMAHFLFMKAAVADRENDLFRRNSKAVENGCNILARVLLLPTQMTADTIGQSLFDIGHVTGLFKEFRVSPEVFIRRLHLSDMRPPHRELNGDGFLALIQENSGVLKVKACHASGAYAPGRFNVAYTRREDEDERKHEHRSLGDCYRQTKWVLEGREVEELDLEGDLGSLLRQEEQHHFELDVSWSQSATIPCEVSFCRIHSRPLAALMAVRVTGDVERHGG